MVLMANESSIISRAINRDSDAFSQLYTEHSAQVFRYLYRKVGSTQEADDLSSETFLQAWRAIDKFEDRGLPFESWLLTIARHVACRHLKNRRPTLDIEDTALAIDAEEQPEQAIEMLGEADEIRRAILTLPLVQRRVIVWRFLEGMSYEEVSNQLGKSQGSVRLIQFRALKRLREIMEAKVA